MQSNWKGERDMGKLDTASAMPLYYQLQEELRHTINAGIYKAGEMIPTEKVLELKYGVSRITVRKAIEELAHEGLLTKKQGKGTVVTRKIVEDDTSVLKGFTEKMEALGKKVSTEVLSVEVIKADEIISKNLDISIGEQVMKIRRLRKIDGEVLEIFAVYIPSKYGIPVTEDFSQSVFDIYCKYGLKPSYSDRKIQAINIDKEVATLLGVHKGDAGMQLHYITFDTKHRIIEYAEGICRGDYYSYKVRIKSE